MNKFILSKKILEYILKSPEIIEAEDLLINVTKSGWVTQNRNTQVTAINNLIIPDAVFSNYEIIDPKVYKLKAKRLSSAISDIDSENIIIEIHNDTVANNYVYKIISETNTLDFIEVEYEEVLETEFIELDLSYDVSFKIETSEKFSKVLDKLLKVSQKVNMVLEHNTLKLIANNYVSGLHKHQTISVINPADINHTSTLDIGKVFTKIIKHESDKNIEFKFSSDVINLKTYFSAIVSEYYILISKS